MRRTNYCADLSLSDEGKEQILCGWVHGHRNLGGLLFIDLRDRTGLVQIVISPENKELFDAASRLRNEYVAEVAGTVQRRAEGAVNKDMKTGEIEIAAKEIKILNTSIPLPFDIETDKNISEEVRLKYRYLDLRNKRMIRNLTVRHNVTKAARDYFSGLGFLEIETPVLTRSTPEGARDYLVPSRVHDGKFYALPQSPQMFKQTLMASGVDRYFQIARCFRDEDLRADRQPEHTQIDMEMSFVEIEDLFAVGEGLCKKIFEAAGEKLETPFLQMTYNEAMEKYGSDKPDLRYGLEIQNLDALANSALLPPFLKTEGGVFRALVLENTAGTSRSVLDKFTQLVKDNGATALLYFKKWNTGLLEGSAKKFFEEREIKIIDEMMKNDSVMLVGYGEPKKCLPAMGALRKELIKFANLAPSEKWKFLWVKNFPLLEFIPEENRYDAAHNPFTAPLSQDIPLLDSDPAAVMSNQFDLVLNGVELASGSVRNHSRALQEKILGLMKHTPEQAALRFGMLLGALECGAPPHGGMGMGLDRITALLCGEDSIKEVIAFPKTTTASCPLTESPNTVDAAQLTELHIEIKR